MTDDAVERGRRIRRLRESRRWTQYDLAAEVEVGRASIHRWEMGRQQPDLKLFMRIARVFEIDPGRLYWGDS
jgi:DNA-binding XRE family transcriptional regulator